MTTSFRLVIESSGAAFDDPAVEVARLLCQVPGRLGGGSSTGHLIDVNGNACGSWTFQTDESVDDGEGASDV